VYLRYLVFDEFGDYMGAFASRIECEPFLRTGCTLKIAPRKPPPNLYELLGGAPF